VGRAPGSVIIIQRISPELIFFPVVPKEEGFTKDLQLFHPYRIKRVEEPLLSPPLPFSVRFGKPGILADSFPPSPRIGGVWE
jgi:hypothetical protein